MKGKRNQQDHSTIFATSFKSTIPSLKVLKNSKGNIG